jgi:hypothetical protein
LGLRSPRWWGLSFAESLTAEYYAEAGYIFRRGNEARRRLSPAGQLRNLGFRPDRSRQQRGHFVWKEALKILGMVRCCFTAFIIVLLVVMYAGPMVP